MAAMLLEKEEELSFFVSTALGCAIDSHVMSKWPPRSIWVTLSHKTTVNCAYFAALTLGRPKVTSYWPTSVSVLLVAVDSTVS